MRTITTAIAILAIALFAASLNSCSKGFDDDNDTQNPEKPNDSCPYEFDNTSIQVYANPQQMVHVRATIRNKADSTSLIPAEQLPKVTLLFSTSSDPDSFREPQSVSDLISDLDDLVDVYARGFQNSGQTYLARLVLTVGNTSTQSQIFNITIPPLPEVQKQQLKAVDLGLSVLWADANLGAQSDTSDGFHIAWGELVPKETYSQENYAHNSIDLDYFISSEITSVSLLDPALEAAGDGWRLPTADEVKELYKNCSYAAERLTPSRSAMRFTAANGNSIILPCAGVCYNDKIVHNDEYDKKYTGKLSGYYLTGTLGQAHDVACCLRFDVEPKDNSSIISVSKNEDVWMGFSIRAVKDR